MNVHVDKLPKRQPDNTWVGVDIELFGMEKGRLHRPDNGTFACLQVAIGEDVYITTDVNIVPVMMQRIEDLGHHVSGSNLVRRIFYQFCLI